jgi:hypothetical protein
MQTFDWLQLLDLFADRGAFTGAMTLSLPLRCSNEPGQLLSDARAFEVLVNKSEVLFFQLCPDRRQARVFPALCEFERAFQNGAVGLQSAPSALISIVEERAKTLIGSKALWTSAWSNRCCARRSARHR